MKKMEEIEKEKLILKRRRHFKRFTERSQEEEQEAKRSSKLKIGEKTDSFAVMKDAVAHK